MEAFGYKFQLKKKCCTYNCVALLPCSLISLENTSHIVYNFFRYRELVTQIADFVCIHEYKSICPQPARVPTYMTTRIDVLGKENDRTMY